MNHLLKVAHLKTGMLALSLLVVVGCSEKPREYAGRYEALSGSGCEVVVAGGQVDFEIAILTVGENTGYMLRLTNAVGDMPTKSNPAAPIEDGSITFYFDHLAQRDFGAKTESTMAIGFRPHPNDAGKILLHRWDLTASTNTGDGGSLDILDSMAASEGYNTLQLPYTVSPDAILCFGNIARLSPDQRADIDGEFNQKSEALIAIAQEENAKHLKAEAQARKADEDLLQAQIEEQRNLSWEQYSAQKIGCESQSPSEKCSAYGMVHEEQQQRRYQHQLTVLGKTSSESLTEMMESCSYRFDPSCRAAQEILRERQATAMAEESRRLQALSYEAFLADTARCDEIGSYTCSLSRDMASDKFNQEVQRLASSESGQALFDLRDEACNSSSGRADRGRCKLMRKASQIVRSQEQSRLVNDRPGLVTIYNACVDEYTALLAQRKTVESRKLKETFRCRTVWDAARQSDIRGDLRKKIT